MRGGAEKSIIKVNRILTQYYKKKNKTNAKNHDEAKVNFLKDEFSRIIVRVAPSLMGSTEVLPRPCTSF